MENFYTLYLDSEIDDATLQTIEQAIGRECNHAFHIKPLQLMFTLRT